MVNPSWGSFQKPQQQNKSQEQKELIQEVPGDIQDAQESQGEKPQWGNFQSPTTYQGEPDPLEDEGFLSGIAREGVQYASRLSEQIAGRYGNMEKFGKDVLSNNPQTGGVVSWALSELMGPEKWETLVRGPKGHEQNLPTSQQLKQISENVTGGYTKPKTSREEKISEFVEDVGSTLSGRRLPTAINNILIPAAANATKQIVKETGFGEDKSNLAKMAVWLPLTLAHNINAPQFASNLMNQGRNGLPNTLQANVPRLTQRLNAVSNSPTFLQSDPRNALARQVLSGIERDVANGQTNIQSLLTTYDAVNAAKRNRGLFELGRNDQAFARRSIDQVRNAVRDEIMDVGANHPEALQNWRNGLQAWSVIHQSNALTNWVEGLAKGPYAKILTGPAAALFGIGSYGASKVPFIAGSATAAVPAAYKTGQVIHRMWNDERLAEYYWNAIHEATQENAPAFINNFNKLNKDIEKSDSAKKKSKTKK